MSTTTDNRTLAELLTDQQRMYRAALWTGVAFFFVYSVFPVYWILVTAFKLPKDIYSSNPTMLPLEPTFQHFETVVLGVNFLRYMLNSVIIAVATTLLILVTCSLAAYALARFEFRGKRALIMSVLLVSMFPPVVFVVSMFRIFSQLGWINTYQGLIVPYTGLFAPMALWILKGFYEQIPRDLEKAARVDGCSRIGALVRVVMPLSAPGLASVAILVFIMSYNEFFWAFIMTSDISTQTMSIGLYNFQEKYAVPWHLISAASVLSVVPIMALILLAQEKIVTGLTAGSVKG